MSLVNICGLRKSYNHSIVNKVAGDREYPVLRGIDFNVEKGDFISIMGHSGCGKTTLLKIMGTIDRPTKGKVFYEDVDVQRLSTDQLAELRKNRIGFVFQDFNLMDNLSVEENIMIPMVLNKAKYRDMRAVVDRNAGLLEISGLLKKYPYELSGGMCQRVMIAMALSCNPKLLIADEPTTALDVTIQAQILTLMNQLKEKTGTSIMLITHDLGVVAQVADNVNVMYAGKVVETAPVVELFKNPKHPYTIGLMHSMPSLVSEGKRLATIEGTVPNPLYLPKGCYFADRCPDVMPICRQKQPTATKIASRHRVWCFLYENEVEEEVVEVTEEVEV